MGGNGWKVAGAAGDDLKNFIRKSQKDETDRLADRPRSQEPKKGQNGANMSGTRVQIRFR